MVDSKQKEAVNLHPTPTDEQRNIFTQDAADAVAALVSGAKILHVWPKVGKKEIALRTRAP